MVLLQRGFQMTSQKLRSSASLHAGKMCTTRYMGPSELLTLQRELGLFGKLLGVVCYS